MLLFRTLQVKLHFTESALRVIAKKAMVKNTGARGLRSLLENILTEAMYEVSKLFPFSMVMTYTCNSLRK